MVTRYIPVIGLEIHLQSKTKSKMFCSCSADYFGKEPNIHTCPVCLGLPGALPVANKQAVEQCILLASATQCEITHSSKFDRKNYFYPDLPKGYQISQFDKPIGKDGYIEYDIKDDSHRIRLIRIHQEEDTGKSTHQDGITYLDFNKSGVPLIEIVTYPDFTNGAEAKQFTKELRRLVRYLGVSDANIEKGTMRIEVNISTKPESQKELPDFKVEIKNIGSITAVGEAIDYEFSRQTVILSKGEKIKDQTRGWDESEKKTIFQRSKESSADYRYFPEPDIPAFEIGKDWLQQIQRRIVELPIARKHRYEKEHNLDKQIATTLTESPQRAGWFETAVAALDSQATVLDITLDGQHNYAKDIANWLLSEVLGFVKQSGNALTKTKILPEHITQIVLLIHANKISGTVAKKLIHRSVDTGDNPWDMVTEENLEQVSDGESITKVAQEVIGKHTAVVEEYKNGKENAIQFLLGQMMKKSKGKINPQKGLEILHSMLDD